MQGYAAADGKSCYPHHRRRGLSIVRGDDFSSPRTHAVTSPLQIKPTLLGFDLGFCKKKASPTIGWGYIFYYRT